MKLIKNRIQFQKRSIIKIKKENKNKKIKSKTKKIKSKTKKNKKIKSKTKKNKKRIEREFD
ncbi:hypothetical protein [Methanimicrococcus stummii]|uniref:hypothetical protein n=1 Tax=Methanimicrococcus stummii TaxID=3028294 RepID=UPI00292DF211|nr:hypothetical protein [Methanimicrococcus sp. Es2]